MTRNAKGSDISAVVSLRSLLVDEERMRSSGWFKHWLETGIDCKPCFYPVFILMHGTFYHHLLEHLCHTRHQ